MTDDEVEERGQLGDISWERSRPDGAVWGFCWCGAPRQMQLTTMDDQDAGVRETTKSLLCSYDGRHSQDPAVHARRQRR